MALPLDVALLLDYARAEAKRLGHRQVVLAHLAAALARKDPEGFAKSFGDDARTRLDRQLQQLPRGTESISDAPELAELFKRAEQSANASETVNAAIGALLKDAPPMATSEAHAGQDAAASAARQPQVAPTPQSSVATTDSPPRPTPVDKAVLLQRLRSRIVGQDAALQVVVDRLALTRMQFDLRPDRPDGVFLLAGASGTGKSSLARALAEFLFGDESRLISLDMSEYAHDWAVSRLIGPQPGYVGSDKPDGWLTTRVRRQPESLILLDEIEKSHPTVWSTFLQVFNDGRLTDGQGKEADFSHTVIVMTSNLGSENFRHRRPIGFRVDDTVADATELTLAAVKEAMPPEFINRLDAIVMFSPLGLDTIREIARREIAGAMSRLRDRGYDTEVPDDVVGFVAEHGYDPAYGARHVQRSIERDLLQTLVTYPPSRLRARLSDGKVSWEAVAESP